MKKISSNKTKCEEYDAVEISESEKESTDIEKVNANPILACEISLGKEIGRGGFAKIHKAIYQGEKVAVKTSLMLGDNSSFSEQFNNEVKIMKLMDHSNYVVHLIGVCTETFPPYIVMEYMPEGNLFHLLQSEIPLSWNRRYNYISDIAHGLNYLHENNILYRDLKSANVLIKDEHNAKLCDFNLALTTDTPFQPEMAAGSTHWRAPETLNIYDQKAMFTKKSDIYSFGITLFEIVERKIPYEDATDLFVKMIVMDAKRPKISPKTPAKLSNFMKWCWDHEPDKRPHASDIVENLKNIKELSFFEEMFLNRKK